MTAPAWWTRFSFTRLNLELLLEGCASALMVRSVNDETGAQQDAERLSTTLDESIRAAEAVLRKGVR